MKANRVEICVLVSLLMLSIAAAAQQVEQPRPLSPTVEMKNVFVMPYGSAISVLPRGGRDFYLQSLAGPDPHEDRVTKVAFQGEEQTALDVNGLAKTGAIPAHEYYLLNFAVDTRGGLASVIAWGDKPLIVSHFAILDVDAEGDVRSFFSLTDGFIPVQAVAFYSGNFLLAGRYLNDPGSTLRMQIRDSHGEVMVRDLHLYPGVRKGALHTAPRETKLTNGATAAPNSSLADHKARKHEPFSDEEAMSPGTSLSFAMAAGEDNRVYAYSANTPNVIDVISSSGQHTAFAVAKLPLPANQIARPIDLYVIGGEVLLHMASFSTQRAGKNDKGLVAQQQYWSAYDPYSGALLQTYTSNSEDWGARSLLAGYSPGNFYFLQANADPSGNVAYTLLHATPE